MGEQFAIGNMTFCIVHNAYSYTAAELFEAYKLTDKVTDWKKSFIKRTENVGKHLWLQVEFWSYNSLVFFALLS